MDASLINNLLKLRRSVIPSGGGPTKKAPVVDWTEYQKRLPTEDEITHWLGNGLHPTLWGIVTGSVSNLVVFDADDRQAMEIFHKAGLNPHVKTKRGEHYYFKHPGHLLNNKVGILPHIDLRGDGGFVNCLGNNELASYEMLVIPTDESLYELKQLPTEIKQALLSNRSMVKINTPISPGEPIPEGQRNSTLTSLAGAMRRKGMTEDEIIASILVANKRCKPEPLPENEIIAIAKSVSRYSPVQDLQPQKTSMKELSQSKVIQWVSLVSGNFNVRQVWSELNIVSSEDKTHLRMILHRLSESGVIAKTAIDGTYRKLENEKKIIDWENANPNAYIPIKLPFDLHRLCKVYPKSIIIVAGSKNEGKTSFLTSCIMPNVNGCGMPVDFYNSETGPEQLKERFTSLNIPRPAPFSTYERYDNFADVIEPNNLSIIDYLDMNSEVYLVGSEIDNIFRKLKDGCAIIGLQKPPPSVTYVKGIKRVIDRDLAYGGGFSAKRAVIYISLSSHKLKLVYVKTPFNPKVNPNNMMWSYEFDENGYFANIKRFYPEEDEPM